MPQDTNAKQAFLYHEIIEEGYSPQEFQQYMSEWDSKAGDDLEAWTMSKLKTLVKQFKNAQKNLKKIETNINNEECSNFGSVILNSPLKQDYFKVIKCQKATQILFPPLPQPVRIQILNYKIKEGSVFEKSYAVYKISTIKLKSCVDRRYNDFIWLKDMLQIFHPQLLIPPIAKKGQYRKYDEYHLNQRMMILQNFLNRLLQSKTLRYQPLVYKFLTIEDTVKFESLKTSIKKPHIPLEKVINPSGEINLAIKYNINESVRSTQLYFQHIQPQIHKQNNNIIDERVYKDFQKISEMFQICENHLKNVAVTCKELNNKDQLYRKQLELPVDNNCIFQLLRDVGANFAHLIFQQANTFKKQIYSVLKYQYMDITNLMEQLQKIAILNEDYNHSKTNLLKKMDKLYEGKKMSKWGTTTKIEIKPSKQQAYQIMLPKQQQQLLKMRNNYALHNYIGFQHCKMYFNLMHDHVAKHIKNFVSANVNISKNMIEMWSNLKKNIKQMSKHQSKDDESDND